MSDHDSPEVYVPSEIYAPDAPHVDYYERPRPRYWLHLLLLLLTFFTTMVVGAHIEWNFLHGWPAFSMDDGIFPGACGRCTADICCWGFRFR